MFRDDNDRSSCVDGSVTERLIQRPITKRSFLKGAFAGLCSSVTPLSFTSSKELSICFGSCQKVSYGQSHWKKIESIKPDAWFFLGDNIYADTRNMDRMRALYDKLARGPYQSFARKTQIEGIWDDHDYGEDGANRTYPCKEESQQIFLDFLKVPEHDPRRQRAGIYYSRDFFIGSKKIKALFLDCRYHKDPEKGSRHNLLGDNQWEWLERELSNSDADSHIFVSSIGVLLNRLFVTEDWAEYPRDRRRLFRLIDRYETKGVFFLSGDKHFGAMIKRREYTRARGRVPYYEFQSSGLTHQPRKEVRRLIPLMYGRSNVLVQKNFAQIKFRQIGESLYMTWNLYTLEHAQPRVMMSREFKLNHLLWKRIK